MVPVWKLFWYPQLRCGANKEINCEDTILRQCGKKPPKLISTGKKLTKRDGWAKMTSEKNMVGQNPPGEGGHEAVLRWKKKVVNSHLGHKDHHHQSSWSSPSSIIISKLMSWMMRDLTMRPPQTGASSRTLAHCKESQTQIQNIGLFSLVKKHTF